MKVFAPNSGESPDQRHQGLFEGRNAESLQKQVHKNRCRGVRPNRASRFNYVHLRREAHPTVPTLSWVDERPGRTRSSHQDPHPGARACAFHAPAARGPHEVRERARPLSQVVWDPSMSTSNGVEGGGGPPRHAAVMSISMLAGGGAGGHRKARNDVRLSKSLHLQRHTSLLGFGQGAAPQAQIRRVLREVTNTSQ